MNTLPHLPPPLAGIASAVLAGVTYLVTQTHWSGTTKDIIYTVVTLLAGLFVNKVPGTTASTVEPPESDVSSDIGTLPVSTAGTGGTETPK